MSKFTQRAIAETFIKLLNQRPMDKITVLDVCKECGISRSTFYYHFSDMFALLESVFHEDVERLLAKSVNSSTWHEAVRLAISFAVDNKVAIYHVYSSLRHDVLERYLFEVSSVTAERLVQIKAQELGAEQCNKEDVKALVSLLSAMLVGLMLDWLRVDLDDSHLDALRTMEKQIDALVRSVLTGA